MEKVDGKQFGFLLWILLMLSTSSSTPSELKEYCNMETFVAECGDDEVIVMDTAVYGRMQTGRCVQVDYGNLGCSIDVLRHFDSLCSGRQKCEVKVPDDELYRTRPCPKDVTSYLQARYTCVKILSRKNLHRQCKQRQMIEVTAPEGIISSSIAEGAGGRHLCPVVIKGAPGQRINMTLLDFGSAIGPQDRGVPGASVICQTYAVLREPGMVSPTRICSGNLRYRGVYLSEGHVVEIQVLQPRHGSEAAHFLLKYSVSGCPNPTLRGHHLVDRNQERAIVRCNHTGHQATIVCRGVTWIGDTGNCTSKPGSWSVWGVLSDDWSTPRGILITVGLGVALGVVIGVTLLFCVLFCLRRRRSRRADQANAGEVDDNLYGRPDYNVQRGGDVTDKWHSEFGNAETIGYPRASLARDGHYAHAWNPDPRAVNPRDVRPPDRVPLDGAVIQPQERDGSGCTGEHVGHLRAGSFGHGMYDKTEHIYEKPT